MADSTTHQTFGLLDSPCCRRCETCSPLISSSEKLFLLKLSCSWATSHPQFHCSDLLWAT